MKKKPSSKTTTKTRNFVAKHLGMNKAATHRDKKNDYKRKPKHKGELNGNV